MDCAARPRAAKSPREPRITRTSPTAHLQIEAHTQQQPWMQQTAGGAGESALRSSTHSAPDGILPSERRRVRCACLSACTDSGCFRYGFCSCGSSFAFLMKLYFCVFTPRFEETLPQALSSAPAHQLHGHTTAQHSTNTAQHRHHREMHTPGHAIATERECGEWRISTVTARGGVVSVHPI